LAGDAAVRIDEQFDTGAPGSMWDWRLMVSLGAGWKPDTLVWLSPNATTSYAAFTARLAALGLTNQVAVNSRAIDYGKTDEQFQFAARYPWSPAAHYFGLVNLADAKLPCLAVVPQHIGNWRGSANDTDGMVWSYATGDVILNLRLRASAHPRSLLHTGEYDPELPLTFCRRQWALIGGTFQGPNALHRFRCTEGFVTLDDYKDWILDWPADPSVTYPRLVFSRDDVTRLQPQLDRLPGAETLKTFLYFNDTDARRTELWKQLTQDSEWASPGGQARAILDRGDPPAMPALFTLQLLTPPDPRFGGARELPNWGHEGADTPPHWLVAAANVRHRDPGLARAFAWAWDQQGRRWAQLLRDARQFLRGKARTEVVVPADARARVAGAVGGGWVSVPVGVWPDTAGPLPPAGSRHGRVAGRDVRNAPVLRFGARVDQGRVPGQEERTRRKNTRTTFRSRRR
jgi:hypothetical protein